MLLTSDAIKTFCERFLEYRTKKNEEVKVEKQIC